MKILLLIFLVCCGCSKKQAPLHACKDYEDGYKAGVLFVVDALIDKQIHLGPLKLNGNNICVSNSVFIIRPYVTGISMKSGTNVGIHNNRFWADR